MFGLKDWSDRLPNNYATLMMYLRTRHDFTIWVAIGAVGGRARVSARLRHTVLVMLDVAMAALSVFVALWLRFDGNIPEQYLAQIPAVVPIFAIIRLTTLWAFRAYSSLWRYATMREAIAATVAVGTGTLLLFAIGTGTPLMTLPRSVYLIEPLLFAVAAGAPRFVVRWRRIALQRAPKRRGKRVLIVGAGDAGAMLVSEFDRQPALPVQVVGFVDDDESKIQRKIAGVRVLGKRELIPEVVNRKAVEQIIIAMPSVEPAIIRETMAICRETGAELKILPPLSELVSGQVRVQDVRDVEIEDLLRREPVETDLTAISGYLRNKQVLVTGAGGSIGSELCRQVCTFEPARLIILDHSENNVFEIDNELRERFPAVAVEPIVADIRHRAHIDQLFGRYRPDVVFHAAAHKHVPLMEANPEEAIANNVLGTRNVADAAARNGAERFVMVSTDKAVHPGNVMGATKRMAELVVQAMQANGRGNGQRDQTRFVSVRFGNVLGSRGSVIPMFREHIRQGGPVRVTHPDMTRYFMTIPEAVQLILQSAAIGEGGEVFVLDMGEPVRIADLAHDLVRLSGLEPGKDIEIVYTGVRPGEKLFEELVYENETIGQTSHEKIMALNGQHIEPETVQQTIERFEAMLNGGWNGAGTGNGGENRADGSAASGAVERQTVDKLVAYLYEAVDGRPAEQSRLSEDEWSSNRDMVDSRRGQAAEPIDAPAVSPGDAAPATVEAAAGQEAAQP